MSFISFIIQMLLLCYGARLFSRTFFFFFVAFLHQTIFLGGVCVCMRASICVVHIAFCVYVFMLFGVCFVRYIRLPDHFCYSLFVYLISMCILLVVCFR